MKRTVLVLAIVTLLTSGIYWAAPAGEKEVLPETKIVCCGKTFTVEFTYSSATGYSWMLASLPKNVILAHTSYKEADCPGCPMKVVFTFVGTMIGEGEIRFVSARPWQIKCPCVFLVTIQKVKVINCLEK